MSHNMSSSKIISRFKRLTELGTCSCDTVPEYADELHELADKTMGTAAAKKKSKLFKALADETRLRIIGLLTVREMCVCEVMVALNLTQPTASHHLGILENVGLVQDRKDGKWVFYSLSNPELFESLQKLSAP
jgi:ArsR family transcriptional regulator, arsenate/arsenite/antimonite-responsive transcriptional repressor